MSFLPISQALGTDLAQISIQSGMAYIRQDGTISHRILTAADGATHRFDGAGPLPAHCQLLPNYTVQLVHLVEEGQLQ